MNLYHSFAYAARAVVVIDPTHLDSSAELVLQSINAPGFASAHHARSDWLLDLPQRLGLALHEEQEGKG